MNKLIVKWKFGEFIEWDMLFVCVGNGFIRSETSVNIHGSLDGNGVLFSTFFHPTCTPSKRYRAERINPFPTKHLAKFQFANADRLNNFHLQGKAG